MHALVGQRAPSERLARARLGARGRRVVVQQLDIFSNTLPSAASSTCLAPSCADENAARKEHAAPLTSGFLSLSIFMAVAVTASAAMRLVLPSREVASDAITSHAILLTSSESSVMCTTRGAATFVPIASALDS